MTQDLITDLEDKVLYEPENPLPPFSFDQLPEALKRNIERLGWPQPTPVQARAIPYLLEGRELIVQARTGSGKTAAYLLPILEKVQSGNKWCQALILAPTRELARQIFEVFKQVVDGTGINGALLYGGVGYGEQSQALRAGAQVVIGTPGRILDHVHRGTFSVQRVRILVLDEADEMLSMGFYPAMRQLRKQLPKERDTFFFSATIPLHVERLAKEFMRQPDYLSLSKGSQSVSTLEHRYYIIQPLYKDKALMDLIEMENPESAIIFCNTKRNVEYLVQVLISSGYSATHITGDLTQKKRERALEKLRSGNLRFLVATDIAARGIDITDLSHVILYDIPEHTEIYVHRSGRTARAGNTGIAITLCESIEEKRLLGIARTYHFTIEKRALPTPEELADRITERLTIQLETTVAELSLHETDRLRRYLPLVESLSENNDSRLLLAYLLDRLNFETMHTPPTIPEERTATPIQEGEKKGKRKKKSKPRREGDGWEVAQEQVPGERVAQEHK